MNKYIQGYAPAAQSSKPSSDPILKKSFRIK
jgi:hypothetical protein